MSILFIRQLTPPKNVALVAQERNKGIEEPLRPEKVFLTIMFVPAFNTSILYLRRFSKGGRRKPRFTRLSRTNKVSPISFFLFSHAADADIHKGCPQGAGTLLSCLWGDACKLPKKFYYSNGMRQVHEKCNISPELQQVNDISLSLCTSVNHSVTVELNDVTLM